MLKIGAPIASSWTLPHAHRAIVWFFGDADISCSDKKTRHAAATCARWGG